MTRWLVALSLAACATRPAEPPAPAEPEPATASIDLDDPQACAACHGAVVSEWTTSLHSRSHHDKDPIYGAMLAFRVGKQGEGIRAGCANCHNPRSPDAPDAPAGLAGVSCATCHNLDGVDLSDGKKGAKALTWAEPGAVRGPHGATSAAAPHAIGPAAPWLTDGKTVCLACHAADANPKGVATCTTGAEHGELEGAPSCTSCHMPEVSGSSGVVSTRETHRSHAFLGPSHLWQGDPSLIAKSATLTGALVGDTLRVQLANTSGHGLPSGFPGRVVLVQVIGRDAAGALVWSNYLDDPMAQDPQAVLTKVYVDDDGKPVMPPFASALAKDTRLRPDETRELTWTGLPPTVASVDVALIYRLMPAKALQTLELGDTLYAGARDMQTLTIRR